MNIETAATLMEAMQGIEYEVRGLAAEAVLTPEEGCILCKVDDYHDHKDGCIGGMVEKIADLAEEIQVRLRAEYGLGRRRKGVSLTE